MKTKETVRAEFAPGIYYFGDICYALKEALYDGIWGKSGYEDGVFDTPQGRFVVAGTAHGDGVYFGSDHKKYPVDAGVLGIVPATLWKAEQSKLSLLGKILSVKNKLVFSATSGVFRITIDSETFVVNTK